MGKRLDGAGVVEDEDEICKLEADLATEAGTGRRDSAWSAPCAVGQASYYEAAAKAARAEEAGLEDGDNGETLGIGENRGRDDLVRTEGLARVDK